MTIRKGDRIKRVVNSMTLGSRLNGLTNGETYTAACDAWGGLGSLASILVEEYPNGTFAACNFEVVPSGAASQPATDQHPLVFDGTGIRPNRNYVTPERPLPDSNPKTRFGVAKPPLSLVPGSFRAQVSLALADGEAKYGVANWRDDPVSASTYLNACERHLTAWREGEEVASDSKVNHLGHAAACLAIIIDAEMCGTLLDDRPTKAPFGDLLKRLTKPMEPST